MLNVKSFSISDAAGVNELLSKYRLAQGMHILVSDGQIMVPYEDGAPKPVAVQAIDILEDRNLLEEKIVIIEHSQNVLIDMMADVDQKLGSLKNEIGDAAPTKEQKGNRDRLASEKAHLSDQFGKNAGEIARMQGNITRFNEKLEAIGFKNGKE